MANPEQETPQLQVTSFADLKAKIQASKDGELVRLPSGLVFRLTRPSISRLLKEDVFPAELIQVAIKLDSNDVKDLNRDDYLKTLEVIDQVVVKSAVEPKLTMAKESTDDTVSVSDLTDDDKMTIYMFAQMGVKPLEQFRTESSQSDAGSSVQEVSGPQA